MSITTLEYRVVHNNVDCGVIILEHLTSGVSSFEIVPAGQSKIRQDWTIVCWRNEVGDWTQ